MFYNKNMKIMFTLVNQRSETPVLLYKQLVFRWPHVCLITILSNSTDSLSVKLMDPFKEIGSHMDSFDKISLMLLMTVHYSLK